MAPVLVLACLLNLLSLGTPVPVRIPEPKKGTNILETLLNANADIGDALIEGDIMTKDNEAKIGGLPGDVMLNASPCTSSTCKWPKNADGNVYIPIYIESAFGKSGKDFIWTVLKGFEDVTCIRFSEIRNKKQQMDTQDYIYVTPGTGCWSYVGRIGGVQYLSLQSNGCLYTDIVEHEILHALGFHHEHTRSDRNNHVTINFDNIIPGKVHDRKGFKGSHLDIGSGSERLYSPEPGLFLPNKTINNFNLVNTNNLETPYDFNSVMQYSNYAFTANGKMTIQAIHDPEFLFGFAQRMSQNDILRVNKLYGCSAYLPQ